jgi:hypothetical protein
VSAADGRVQGATQVIDHGAKDRRFNLVFLSEAYTAGELDDYITTVHRAVTALRITPPFRDLWPNINVFRIDVESTESGPDIPATGTSHRTFFDSRLGAPPRVTCDVTAVHRVCKDHVSEYHVPVVIVNVSAATPGEFGTAPEHVAVLSARHYFLGGVIAHELGHSAFNLADEYDDPGDQHHFSGTAPPEPNVTTITDPARVPWRSLATLPLTPAVTNPDCSQPSEDGGVFGPTEIGLFEGARRHHCGIFRPAGDCRMRTSSTQFCTVCMEEGKRVLRRFRPLAMERSRFGVEGGPLLLTGVQLDAGPAVLAYDTGSGVATLWAVAADAGAVNPTFTSQWNLGVSQVVPIALAGSAGLLIYNGQTGRVEIDRIAGDGTSIVTVWPSQWTTGWASIVSYACAGQPFLFSYKETEGRATIDRVAGDGSGVSGRFDGPIGDGFTAFVAAERTDWMDPAVRPGGALLLGYRGDSAELVAWTIPDDGSSLTEIARMSTIAFATSMVGVRARNELIVALNNAVNGETRWVYASDIGISIGQITPAASGIHLAELGTTAWSLGWTAIASFQLGGQPHWIAYRAGDGTLVIDRIE